MGKRSNINPRVSQTCPLRCGQYKGTSALCMCVRACSCETSYVEGKNRIYVLCRQASCRKEGKIAELLEIIVIRLSPFTSPREMKE